MHKVGQTACGNLAHVVVVECTLPTLYVMIAALHPGLLELTEDLNMM